ncbi:TPA: adenylyl-sulfate kinase [Candidatus Geothermarchaeota archaeon]|nr:adenylyl-sulfate kinase [Candidatus Geothermarchaeota archaeon]HIQ13043.1 adenylyl-sulfate kinase [Thermoprotei archaeon]
MAYIIWFTGLPSSGKTTLGGKLTDYMRGLGVEVEWMDSDVLRRVLTPKPSYSLEERDWFYNVLIWLAKRFYSHGINVVISATGNKRIYRDTLRGMVDNFIEIYLKCDLKVCIERDVKGVYKMGLDGLSKTVPGIGVSYEEPQKPEITIETDKYDVDESFNILIEKLRGLGVI